jgi:hypothetical protein
MSRMSRMSRGASDVRRSDAGRSDAGRSETGDAVRAELAA